MKLPHLNRRIPLHWGEAHQLAYAVETMLCQDLESGAQLPIERVLGIEPLYRVMMRLKARARTERAHTGPPPRKPWQFTLYYNEVAALMLIFPDAPLAGQAWGEIQRVSLTLEQFIEFPPLAFA